MISWSIMGVVNVTPDSFSDGGEYFDHQRAIEHGRELFRYGAEIVDVGGESTRPFANVVDEKEEIRRVTQVIEGLAPFGRVSVDTRRASVARAAVAAGATMVNDVSASLGDLAQELGVAWVAMHMKGQPQTMQESPYYEDVVGEVCSYLSTKYHEALRNGVREIYLDPGIGFGKTARHNLELLRSISRIVEIGAPVIVGVSRKNFLSKLTTAEFSNPPGVKDRLEGSLACALWCVDQGVAMVRVHDVEETSQLRELARVAADSASAIDEDKVVRG